ncbi:hypothetical protein M0Q28_06085 [Patescibacteria group bacterium]|jgi:hypothetical protein|nr:hypothetical protein [Patescibacteria group bacterium]
MTRQLLAGRPTWLAQPLLVIPAIELRSSGGGFWSVRFMFPISPISLTTFSYVERNLAGRDELDKFLTDWEESPETAVQVWFHREAPRRSRAGEFAEQIPQVAANAQDLGL